MMEGILGSETPLLLSALDGEPQVSIRYNPFKVSTRPEGEGVPWNRYGYYLSERPIFTFDPLFHAGQYYVQEASSMFVGHLLEGATEGAEGLRLLDLCAAPGGKTTLYSAQVGLEGLMVANEPVRNRAKVLAEN
ncbi:MAG: rRNA cytosine-C5-methylase, partial [Tidjanibacter sp.]|nr:rRNA cytosine-C5-methylase [Tidjanibacter sp.]